MRTSFIAFLVGLMASLLAVATFTSDLGAQTVGRGLEYNFDRPGNDYRNFDLSSNDPRQCQAACARDGRCVAFTFVRPGVQGPEARCWLKDVASAPVRSDCCVSGLSPTPARSARLEPEIDRPGSDIFNTPLPPGRGPSACRDICLRNGSCRAFTYVNAGVQGPEPRCWIKNAVPAPVSNPCCTSGVVR